MTLQTSGEISLGGSTAGRSVNLTLGRSATASINMNDSFVRGIAGRGTGAISFSDFYGKTLSYSIVPNVTSVNEGSSVTFTVTTQGVLDGTTLFWTTQTVSGTVNTSDFTDSAVSGSFTINNNTATITRTLRNDTATEGTESFILNIRTGSTSGTIVANSSTITINDTSLTLPGQVVFTSSKSGTSTTATQTLHTWIVPPGVTSISILCVGAGGGGRSVSQFNFPGYGGGGGALAYSNNISVTPGLSVSIEVGDGGAGVFNSTNTSGAKAGDGGFSAVFAPSLVVLARGGLGGGTEYTTASNGLGGSASTSTGQVRHSGGNGGKGSGVNGGGGAAGYSGNGGLGGGYLQTLPSAGAGGGGGGGGYGRPSSSFSAGFGGGVGILGQGANGSAGVSSDTFGGNSSVTSGGSGSGGGSIGSTGWYGGGAPSSTDISGRIGAKGIVRIIWPGNLRQFPSTRTADE